MGRKNNGPKYQLWSAVDTATNPTSEATSVHQVDHVCYELEYGAAVNALISVEFSNDPDNAPIKTWRAVEFGQSIALNGAVDTQTNIVFREMPFKSLRLKITNTGGTGNISAWISSQTRGA